MVGRSGCSRAWLEQTVSRLVTEAPENVLPDFGNLAIFDAPLVGVADGDDPLFLRFRQVVSPGHILPRELLERERGSAPARVRVVVWAMPFTKPVRESNRGGRWPSRLYSLARNNGGALSQIVRRRLVGLLRAGGWAAAAPVLSGSYDAFRSPEHVFSSTWSERHAAFAAGLGQFGLNRALITARGSFVRIASVVTDLDVAPTPRPYDDYAAPCLASRGEVCGRCMDRCPAGAISAAGMDKSACYAMRNAVRARSLEGYVREMRMLRAEVVKSGRREAGYSLGCALCMCGVPCAARDPFTTTARTRYA